MLLRLFLVLVMGTLAVQVHGAVDNGKPDAPPPVTHPDKQKPAKDPTELSPKMKQALNPERRAEIIAREPDPPPLPEVTLKGLVKSDENNATAIIEIKGAGTHLVRAGAEVVIKDAAGATTLKISKVTSDGVEIEIPALRKTITVR